MNSGSTIRSRVTSDALLLAVGRAIRGANEEGRAFIVTEEAGQEGRSLFRFRAATGPLTEPGEIFRAHPTQHGRHYRNGENE